MKIEASNSNPGAPRVLIGGVPFGRDNVGDEAILECVVEIVRWISPHSPIAVSTDDPGATAAKLGVESVPLFGFDPPGYDPEQMDAALRASDVFIWAGATGLSDYPEVPLRLLRRAQELQRKTVVFCTGMNDELNPALYRLQPGRRKTLGWIVRLGTLGALDLTRRYEERKRLATCELMREVIPVADLVVLRDEPSRQELARVIGSDENLREGADPAILISPLPVGEASFGKATLAALDQPGRKVGLCISAQSPCRELEAFAGMLDRLIAGDDVRVFGIPMNPITDFQLMEDLRGRLQNPDRFHVVEGRFEPDEIAGLAAEMEVVISSRLHLLILASISGTPVIGISRGSKVTNYTSQFELPDVGSVDSLDLHELEREIRRLLGDGGPAFRELSPAVLDAMNRRLERATGKLAGILGAGNGDRSTQSATCPTATTLSS